jgi:hypothetical protein
MGLMHELRLEHGTDLSAEEAPGPLACLSNLMRQSTNSRWPRRPRFCRPRLGRRSLGGEWVRTGAPVNACESPSDRPGRCHDGSVPSSCRRLRLPQATALVRGDDGHR